MDDIKEYNLSDIKVIPQKKLYQVKIVSFNYTKGGRIKALPCVLKREPDGTNYLSELHLVNHDFGWLETLCYLYDDLTSVEQEQYKDQVETILVRYPEVRNFGKPKKEKNVKKLSRRGR